MLKNPPCGGSLGKNYCRSANVLPVKLQIRFVRAVINLKNGSLNCFTGASRRGLCSYFTSAVGYILKGTIPRMLIRSESINTKNGVRPCNFPTKHLLKEYIMPTLVRQAKPCREYKMITQEKKSYLHVDILLFTSLFHHRKCE